MFKSLFLFIAKYLLLTIGEIILHYTNHVVITPSKPDPIIESKYVRLHNSNDLKNVLISVQVLPCLSFMYAEQPRWGIELVTFFRGNMYVVDIVHPDQLKKQRSFMNSVPKEK